LANTYFSYTDLKTTLPMALHVECLDPAKKAGYPFEYEGQIMASHESYGEPDCAWCGERISDPPRPADPLWVRS
jgi:hypothetical protein